jgi:hydroxymethylpyrimidine pyrophosphatase-like HAD family hydrolase
MIYIFDIDGTLADLSHRLHFIQQKPADWDAFFAACPSDVPIPEVTAILRSLRLAGHTVVLCSGRSDAVRIQTQHWMRELEIGFSGLYMRKAGDHREDSVIKAELLDQILKDWSGQDIGGVFEDRQQVVAMYRAKGLRVFQVAEGKF